MSDWGLTGTHVGCDTSQCGACDVHVDGKLVKACSIFAQECDGAEVKTIEGMANPDGSLGVIQQAFQDHHGLQCGFCTPGMVMAAASLLAENPQPTEDRDPLLPRRQHLPLHRLPQHRQGDPGGIGAGRAADHRRRVTAEERRRRQSADASQGGMTCLRT